MNKTLKIVLAVFIGLVVAFLAGWLYGASGKSDLTRTATAAELRSQLLEARNAVLDARLDIYAINFGNASRHLENARSVLRGVGERFKNDGPADNAKRVEDALTRIDRAQQMSGKLDQSANAEAD